MNEPPLVITATTPLHPDMPTLRGEAAHEGFHFLDRLVKEWQIGANRFEKRGELFLGASQEASLVAVCGLNRDPYADRPDIGRLRHLYVAPTARRQGVATALVRRLLAEADAVFTAIRLRTPTQEAAAFYTRLGFTESADETASHVMTLHP